MLEPKLPSFRALTRIVIATAVATAALGMNTGTAHAADVIEQEYLATGSWAVTWDDGRSGGCSSTDPVTSDYTYVYPTNLGAGGTDHPIVVWGNGTDATGEILTCGFEVMLTHLASWGFVVISPNIAQSGTGTEMVGAAFELAGQNGDSSSPFFGKLDTSSIAAAGHSQGALGAINAAYLGSTLFNDLFESVLAISTPDRNAMEIYNDPECDGVFTQYFCCDTIFGDDCVPVPLRTPSEMNNLDAPILFARGSADVISNETADDWFPTGTGIPFAEASRDGAGHVVNLDQAMGYMTAWLRYTVTGDVIARGAFVGSPPEIPTNTNWNNDPPTLQNLP